MSHENSQIKTTGLAGGVVHTTGLAGGMHHAFKAMEPAARHGL